MQESARYKVVGLMSGTSLDGLDIAFCTFKKGKAGWKYKIEKASTIRYSATWLKKLSEAHLLEGEDLIALDAQYGKYLGDCCREFLSKDKFKPDFIASHGHTIFHQPA